MNVWRRTLLFSIVICLLCVGLKAQYDDLPEDLDMDASGGKPVGNKMVFKPPEISEEEQHSSRVPAKMICDGCKAVAYQLGTKLEAFHDLKFKKKRAPESEVLEEVENICESTSFEGYGLKSMNGVNRISGPGTDAVDEPGMMQGGGKWPHRLRTTCGELVGEVDEMQIYDYVVKNGGKNLFKMLCEDSSNRELNSCGRLKDEL